MSYLQAYSFHIFNLWQNSEYSEAAFNN